MRACLLAMMLCCCQACAGQQDRLFQDSLVRHYFTVSPAGLSFAELVYELVSGMEISPDTVIKKTDSTLFYLRGYSYTFNPFAMPVQRLELQVREEVPRTKTDGPPGDTLLVIQVIGITDASQESESLIRDELARITRGVSKSFHHTNYKKSNRKDSRPFASYAYFKQAVRYPTLVMGWGGHYEDIRTHCISVSLRYQLSY